MEYIERIFGQAAGQSVRVTPDHILLTDGPGHDVAEALLEAGTAPAAAIRDKLTIVLDHDIPAGSFQTAFIQKHLIDYAKAYSIDFRQSAGIAYYMLYNEVKPGEIFVSAGEHNTIFGAKGAIGLSLTDEALQQLIEQGSFDVTVPETVHITITGALSAGVSMLDAALALVNFQSAPSFPHGKAVVYHTAGCDLTEADRKLLALLAARSGAATAYFDETAAPDGALAFDLSGVAPAVAKPGSIQSVDLQGEEGIAVNACFIGGCMGGRIEDLRLAASILEGRRIKRELRLLIGFVDNATYLQAVHEGLVNIFFDCGAQVTNPGCASCQTTSIGVVGNGEVLATTGCYNYIGCSGTKESRLYIASVENVARAALTGVLSGKEA